MDAESIKRARKIIAAATPGPWCWREEGLQNKYLDADMDWLIVPANDVTSSPNRVFLRESICGWSAALDYIDQLKIVAKHARRCSNGQPYVSEECWDGLDAALKNIGVIQWETIPTITDCLENEITKLRAENKRLQKELESAIEYHRIVEKNRDEWFDTAGRYRAALEWYANPLNHKARIDGMPVEIRLAVQGRGDSVAPSMIEQGQRAREALGERK